MIKVQLEEADYLAAQFLQMRWTRLQWSQYGGASAALLGSGLLLTCLNPTPVLNQQTGITLIGVVAGTWIAGVAIYFVYWPTRMRHLVRQQSRLDASFEVSWNTDEIVFFTFRGKQVIAWSQFIGWREDDQMILLYQADAQMRMLPKRAFPSAPVNDDFMQVVRQKVATRV